MSTNEKPPMLWQCNQETGRDYLIYMDGKTTDEVRAEFRRRADRGSDAWLILPDGSKELPCGRIKLSNVTPPKVSTNEHNPDNLTPEQYGAPVWRLLLVGEPTQEGDEFNCKHKLCDPEWDAHPSRVFGEFPSKYVTWRRRVTPPSRNP